MRLNSLSDACAYNTNLYEVCYFTNNFKSWIEVSFEELEVAFLKEAKRNFHARLPGIVEPLLQKFSPIFLLPTPVVTPLPSLIQSLLVVSELSLQVASVSGAKMFMVSDEFILMTFERLTVANYEVKEQLKSQDEKTYMLAGMLGELLSRLPPRYKL